MNSTLLFTRFYKYLCGDLAAQKNPHGIELLFSGVSNASHSTRTKHGIILFRYIPWINNFYTGTSKIFNITCSKFSSTRVVIAAIIMSAEPASSPRLSRLIRINEGDGIFRVMYVAKFEEAIYVLHSFQKKTQQTAKKDIDLACMHAIHFAKAEWSEGCDGRKSCSEATAHRAESWERPVS